MSWLSIPAARVASVNPLGLTKLPPPSVQTKKPCSLPPPPPPPYTSSRSFDPDPPSRQSGFPPKRKRQLQQLRSSDDRHPRHRKQKNRWRRSGSATMHRPDPAPKREKEKSGAAGMPWRATFRLPNASAPS